MPVETIVEIVSRSNELVQLKLTVRVKKHSGTSSCAASKLKLFSNPNRNDALVVNKPVSLTNPELPQLANKKPLA
jgi:hypothetical protein